MKLDTLFRTLLPGALCLGLAACDGDSTTADAGAGDGGVTADAGTTVRLDSTAKIEAFLTGRTLTMEGSNIPSHPNGYASNTNFGQATQCYNKTIMTYSSGQLSVTTTLGTLTGAPNTGDVGTCDTSTVLGSPLVFASTAVLIENVSGDADCFDISVTYPGFAQEGRGRVAADKQSVILELFFKDQATGHRCAAGAVGAATVQLRGAAFTGNAQQVYAVTTN